MRFVKQVYNRFFVRPYYKSKLNKVGELFRLGYSSEILKPEFFSFGENFFSGPRCYMSTNKHTSVNIMNDVMFGPEVMILGGNHDFQFCENHMIHNTLDLKRCGDVIVNSGVWIGARSILLSGSNISEGCVVGANSIVNHYIPPYVIAVGSPAKKYKKRFDSDSQLESLLIAVNSKYSIDEINVIYEKYKL